MRRVLAALAGIIVGVVAAGAAAPLIFVLVPLELRGPWLVWLVGGVTVVTCAAASWILTAPRRE